MYFPYFRGRQYELLALKELVKGRLLSESVIPVVEPVKLMSTFDSTLKTFADAGCKIALIFNPAVGQFAGSENFIDVYYARMGGALNVEPTLLMNKNALPTLEALESRGLLRSNMIAFLDKRDFLDTYKGEFAGVPPQYTLFPDEREFRRTVTQGKVMFKDCFSKQSKNADYPEDEFFTEDHLFYKSEGYVGFGDYSIIGSEYNEGGFAPYAVAIHIVYFDNNDNLRIRHFVSDSNEDTSDVAGKFSEAVTKLLDWYNDGQERQSTMALDTLLSHAHSGYYPGLPTIKKLSIMHHLELVGKFLDGDLPE